MLKRYIAFFGWKAPWGGWGDFEGSDDDLEATKSLVNDVGSWAHVVDTRTGEVHKRKAVGVWEIEEPVV